MARGRRMQEAAKETAHTESSKLKVVSFKPEEGSVVEVRSDEEKVWYIATVLRMERARAYVEYCSLVLDEGSSEPMRGYVNVEFIRPLPPREKKGEVFEVGHVVDGYYQDGWWTGVITGVVYPGVSFVVTFLDTANQQHVFGLSKIRFHRRWVNGKWEKPGKQDTHSLLFGAGKMVEVVCRDRFIPATIVEERGNGLYLVHYGTKREISVIRPTPPPLKDHIFQLGDKVDASFESAWWCGTVTQLLPDSTFKVVIELDNHQKRFSQTELRLHLDWNQGKWDSTGRVLPKGPNQVQNKTKQSLPQTYKRKRKDVHEDDASVVILNKAVEEIPSNDTVRGSQGNDDGACLVTIATSQNTTAGDVQLQGDSETSQESIKRQRGRPRKISATSPSAKEALVDKVMTVDQEAEVNAVKSDVAPTRGSAKEAMTVDQEAMEDHTQEAVVNAVESDMAPTGGSAKEATVDRVMTDDNDAVKDVDDPTQEAVVNAKQSDVASDKITEEGPTIDTLPFVKEKSLLWSAVESLEPFRKWPQKPHFRPLQQYVESGREGKAIGLMISFADIVEKSSTMEFLHKAKSSGKELLELEENGFDVKVVRDRMAMRESREKLQGECEEINGEIARQQMEMVELDKHVEDLKMQMKKVQEQMSEAVSKKEAKSRGTASLQLKLEELKKGMMLPGDSLFAD